MKKPLAYLATSILMLWSGYLTAAETTFRSGPEQVPLIELYTSQGCSSCPPADRWMSNLKDEPGLWRDFVPVAFHVDYWDYIGWRDPFAQHKFGQRQRKIARQGGARTVYTPGMILAGKDWWGWRNSPAPDRGTQRPGELVVTVEGQSVEVSFAPLKAPAGKVQINVAWLEFDQLSEVRAGENRGKDLGNDFIVRKWWQDDLPLKDGAYMTSMKLPNQLASGDRSALAVWVDQKNSLVPLQATGGWLR